MQFLIIANQVRSLQYLLASLKRREVARKARRREFPRTAVRYNNFIIPKEFTLFFLSTQDSFNLCKDLYDLIILIYIWVCVFSNHYTIIIIQTRICAPSNHYANYNHGGSCHGAPSRRALQNDVRALQRSQRLPPRGSCHEATRKNSHSEFVPWNLLCKFR